MPQKFTVPTDVDVAGLKVDVEVVGPWKGVMSPQKGVMSPQKGVMSPQDAVIGRSVVAMGVKVEGAVDAACACTARRETPAMAARAMELLRFEILRDMTASSGRNDTDEQPAYDPSGVNRS